MVARGMVFGAIAAGGAILTSVAIFLLADKKKKPTPSLKIVPPPPAQVKTPDTEESYEHEMGLVASSLPSKLSLEFGRYYDAIGTLIVSCPSDEGSKRISDISIIAIVCRNRLWGLSNVVEYASAVPMFEWAELEMERVLQTFSPSPEWLQSGLNVSREFFKILRKSQYQLSGVASA